MNKNKGNYRIDEINKNKKIGLKKVIVIALIVILAVYIIYVIYNLIKQPTDVFMVENGKVYLSEMATGYIIRDEKEIQGENYKNGIVKIKEEGQRVAKGEAVYRYYTAGEENLRKKIDDLSQQIQEIMNTDNNLFPSDIKLLDNQIEQKLKLIYNNNEIEKINEYKKEIAAYINKKAKIAGEKSPAGSYMKKLVDERSKYENELNSNAEYIEAPMSGIVSYRVDNLESILTTNEFGYLNKKLLEELNIKTGQIISSSEECAKIIDNFNCYIATIMNSQKAKEAKIGDVVKLQSATIGEIDASIEYISYENENEVLIVFKINKGIEELIKYRKVSFNVIWWEYSGLKVPNSAIVYEDDKAYIVRNRAGYLDKILVKVLRKNEDYSIVNNYEVEELEELGYTKSEIAKMNNIALYDEVLVSPNLNKVQ